MKSNNIVAFLATIPLILMNSVGAQLCSLGSSNPPPMFDQSCRNSCSTGADAGALVGPGVLTSGDASSYDVAAIYFGHQN